MPKFRIQNFSKSPKLDTSIKIHHVRRDAPGSAGDAVVCRDAECRDGVVQSDDCSIKIIKIQVDGGRRGESAVINQPNLAGTTGKDVASPARWSSESHVVGCAIPENRLGRSGGEGREEELGSFHGIGILPRSTKSTKGGGSTAGAHASGHPGLLERTVVGNSWCSQERGQRGLIAFSHRPATASNFALNRVNILHRVFALWN